MRAIEPFFPTSPKRDLTRRRSSQTCSSADGLFDLESKNCEPVSVIKCLGGEPAVFAADVESYDGIGGGRLLSTYFECKNFARVRVDDFPAKRKEHRKRESLSSLRCQSAIVMGMLARRASIASAAGLLHPEDGEALEAIVVRSRLDFAHAVLEQSDLLAKKRGVGFSAFVLNLATDRQLHRVVGESEVLLSA